MSQGSLNPKIRFLGQKVCSVARSQTHTQTHKVTTEGTLSDHHQGSAQLLDFHKFYSHFQYVVLSLKPVYRDIAMDC